MIKERSNKVDNSIPNGWIVPMGWKLEKFKDITDILKCGIASTPTYVEKGVPFLSSQNVKENRINLEKYNYISEEYHEFLTKNNKPKKGDILYTRVGANFGLAAVSNLDFEYSVYVSLTHIRMKEGYNSTFYSYMLNSDRYRNLARRSVFQGGGVPNLNVKIVENFNMLIPPLEEQDKIAEILSTWDSAIEKQEQLIEKKKEFKKGLMQRLLSGKVRFKEFNDEWVSTKINHYIKPVIRECEKPTDAYWRLGLRSHGKGTFHELVEDPASVSMDKLYIVKNNDLIVNITFAWEHAIAVADKNDEGKLVSHRFPTYEFNENAYPKFFKYYILQSKFKHILVNISPGGAGRNRVMNKKDFLNISVKIPSYEEQAKIAEVLSAADKEIELLEKELEALKLQKKGLMQRLLTGEVRVKV